MSAYGTELSDAVSRRSALSEERKFTIALAADADIVNSAVGINFAA